MALPQHKPAVIVLVSLLVLAAVGSGVGLLSRQSRADTDAEGLPTGPVSTQFLAARPEGHLVYPGAQLVFPFGNDEQHSIEGASSAATGGVYATADTPDQVYAWYRDWLLQHGWHEARFARATTFTSIQGYTRGSREAFYVAMNDSQALAQTTGHQIPMDSTVFEVRYLVAPADQ